MKRKRKQPVTFTVEETKVLQDAASAVWDEVGADLLTSVAESNGQSVDEATVTREEVIEIALDAGRAEDKLRDWMRTASRYGKREQALLIERTLEKMGMADYDTLIAAVTPRFKFASYGM